MRHAIMQQMLNTKKCTMDQELADAVADAACTHQVVALSVRNYVMAAIFKCDVRPKVRLC